MEKISKNIFATILVFVVIVATACQSTSFLNRVRSFDGQLFVNEEVDFRIFKLLKDTLDQNARFIYIYNFINHQPTIGTRDFNALVYDRKSNKTYYFQNKSLSKLEITQTSNNSDYHVVNSILKYYLMDKVNEMKAFENKDISEGGLWLTVLYDVNLKRKNVAKCQFESLTFDKSGNLITFSDYMRGAY